MIWGWIGAPPKKLKKRKPAKIGRPASTNNLLVFPPPCWFIRVCLYTLHFPIDSGGSELKSLAQQHPQCSYNLTPLLFIYPLPGPPWYILSAVSHFILGHPPSDNWNDLRAQNYPNYHSA